MWMTSLVVLRICFFFQGEETLVVNIHAYPVIHDLYVPSHINLFPVPLGDRYLNSLLIADHYLNDIKSTTLQPQSVHCNIIKLNQGLYFVMSCKAKCHKCMLLLCYLHTKILFHMPCFFFVNMLQCQKRENKSGFV